MVEKNNLVERYVLEWNLEILAEIFNSFFVSFQI